MLLDSVLGLFTTTRLEVKNQYSQGTSWECDVEIDIAQESDQNMAKIYFLLVFVHTTMAEFWGHRMQLELKTKPK